jgi:hypothetical protein
MFIVSIFELHHLHQLNIVEREHIYKQKIRTIIIHYKIIYEGNICCINLKLLWDVHSLNVLLFRRQQNNIRYRKCNYAIGLEKKQIFNTLSVVRGCRPGGNFCWPFENLWSFLYIIVSIFELHHLHQLNIVEREHIYKQKIRTIIIHYKIIYYVKQRKLIS